MYTTHLFTEKILWQDETNENNKKNKPNQLLYKHRQVKMKTN